MTTYIGETRKGERVVSALSDREARDILAAGRRDEFAISLIAAFDQYGPRLSDGRRVWLHKLAVEAGAQATIPAPIGDASLAALVARFVAAASARKARKRVKGAGRTRSPSATLTARDGSPVELKLAGNASKYSGGLTVTNGKPYGDPSGVWYGAISPSGVWTRSRAVTEPVAALVAAFAADTAGVADAQGREADACCFCDTPLFDKRSTSKGYGPICAGNYGLPWGDVPSDAAPAVAPTSLATGTRARIPASACGD